MAFPYHSRRSVRLPDFDYSSPGAYFVTICTKYRECLFGDIEAGEMRLNWVGKIVQDEWRSTTRLRNRVSIDEFRVMPNHIHGIIRIDDDRRGTARRAPTIERFGKPTKDSLPTIVRSYKSAVSKRVHDSIPLFGSVWQRNFYERIIRNDEELDIVRKYIQDNPSQWKTDADFHS